MIKTKDQIAHIISYLNYSLLMEGNSYIVQLCSYYGNVFCICIFVKLLNLCIIHASIYSITVEYLL